MVLLQLNPLFGQQTFQETLRSDLRLVFNNLQEKGRVTRGELTPIHAKVSLGPDGA